MKAWHGIGQEQLVGEKGRCREARGATRRRVERKWKKGEMRGSREGVKHAP